MELLIQKENHLLGLIGVKFRLVGVADTSGAAVSADGLDVHQIMGLKSAGMGVAQYEPFGHPGMSPLELVRQAPADLLLEASPGNLEDGQPGLGAIDAALSRGLHVVTANKAPLVLEFPRLSEMARAVGVKLRYDATVAGGLAAVNLGRRDLAIAQIERLEGIVNLTTNYILTRMAEDGLTYEEALADAQVAGHAETDPSLDVQGWDAASKLVILAHSVLDFPATLEDIPVEGITGVSQEELAEAVAAGRRVKLLATATRQGTGYALSVSPVSLEMSHPLARLGPKQMGVVYHTDICGVVAASIVEETPVPTAAAMLRDVVDIYRP
jgi:homoserine dehydrogenase